jgi:hypothetical protein
MITGSANSETAMTVGGCRDEKSQRQMAEAKLETKIKG